MQKEAQTQWWLQPSALILEACGKLCSICKKQQPELQDLPRGGFYVPYASTSPTLNTQPSVFPNEVQDSSKKSFAHPTNIHGAYSAHQTL
jgi:hypothetical protein